MGVLRLFSGRTLAERYLERGLHFLDKKKYDDALADLTSAIGEEALNAELYATRGFIYLESDREEYLEYARADFEYALYLDPKQWVAEYCLGMIGYAEEHFEEALRRFTVARDLAHLHPEPYYYRALCFYKLHEHERAAKEMDLAFQVFEQQDDRRKSQAKRWKKIFEKELRQLKKAGGNRPALTSGAATGAGSTLDDSARPSVVDSSARYSTPGAAETSGQEDRP